MVGPPLTSRLLPFLAHKFAAVCYSFPTRRGPSLAVTTLAERSIARPYNRACPPITTVLDLLGVQASMDARHSGQARTAFPS